MKNVFVELVKQEKLNVEEMENMVFRGICKKSNHSTNLQEGKTYYLIPHGTSGSHAFVSIFPNAARSQMGIYQTERFNVVGVDLLANVKTPLKTEQKVLEPVKEELAKPNENAIIGEVKKEEEQVITSVSELPFAADMDIQDEQIEPKVDDFPQDLLWDEVYRAELRYRRSGFSHIALGEYYVKRFSNDHYGEMFKDVDCKERIGNFPLSWFKDFQLTSESTSLVREEEDNDEYNLYATDDSVEVDEELNEVVEPSVTPAPAEVQEEVVEQHEPIVIAETEVKEEKVAPGTSILDVQIVTKKTKKKKVEENEEQLGLFDMFF